MMELPKQYVPKEVESKWRARWQEMGIYRWDPVRARNETFVVDSPPPTVSGSLHVGHVFSYTHQDLIVRQRRMAGMNIFYPMGWDDNGLPTERRVQNFFNVRCDPYLPYLPNFKPRSNPKEPPEIISRPNFIELCRQLTQIDEKAFQELWQQLGLSIDWEQEYATIDDHCRRTSQLSFLKLLGEGHAYATEAPTLWDVDFQTAVAQAEVEDRPLTGAFHHIRFGVEGGGSFVVATTRPELLPACVAIVAHPDDQRYQSLFGKRAVTPLFRAPVPILADERASIEKGTGILMVCTFGDATDVEWWRQFDLPLRQVVGKDGRLIPVQFGSPGWESLDPDAANAFYERIARERRPASEEGHHCTLARRKRQRASRTWPAVDPRASAYRTCRKVLREGRATARIHLDPPVVCPVIGQEKSSARAGCAYPVASGVHAIAL